MDLNPSDLPLILSLSSLSQSRAYSELDLIISWNYSTTEESVWWCRSSHPSSASTGMNMWSVEEGRPENNTVTNHWSAASARPGCRRSLTDGLRLWLCSASAGSRCQCVNTNFNPLTKERACSAVSWKEKTKMKTWIWKHRGQQIWTRQCVYSVCVPLFTLSSWHKYSDTLLRT